MSVADADQLFRRLDREVWLVTSRAGEQRAGLIATSVMSVSIVPTVPRVAVAIGKQHATWEIIEASGAFTLQLLPLDAQLIFERFAMHSSRDIDKFADFDWDESRSAGPLLKGSIGWLDCQVEARFDTGDRTIFLGAVRDAATPSEEGAILTIHQLFQSAPESWLPTLRRQLADDAAVDRIAIKSWRERQAVRLNDSK